MIIRTRHSTYRLAQDGDQTALTKIEDYYPGPGPHPGTKVGDVFKGTNPKPPVIGESFWLRGDWGTSAVTDIKSEPGDESLRFDKLEA